MACTVLYSGGPKKKDKYISLKLFSLVQEIEKEILRDFPGGAVVETPPANAGDTGSISGPGRSHMPRSN